MKRIIEYPVPLVLRDILKKKSSGEETRFAVSSAFKEGETYLINLEGANRYEVIHKAYSLY